MWQLTGSSLRYPALNVFPFHFKVYFGLVSTFWVRYLLGKPCFQRGLARGFGSDEQTPRGQFGKASGVTTATFPVLASVCVGPDVSRICAGYRCRGVRLFCQSTAWERWGRARKQGWKTRTSSGTYFSPLRGCSLEESTPWALTLVCQMWFSRLLEH